MELVYKHVGLRVFDFCFGFQHNGRVKRNRGFTLMEIMIVIGLIMILSVVGIGSFILSTVKSRDSQRKSNLNQIGKAAESFYADVGHYPLSEPTDTPHCFESVNGVGEDITCANNKLYSSVDGVITVYITIPSDPDASREYLYISDGSSYAMYAALENMQDRDLLKKEDGSVNQDPWELSCGSVQCNYKITETGLVKSL